MTYWFASPIFMDVFLQFFNMQSFKTFDCFGELFTAVFFSHLLCFFSFHLLKDCSELMDLRNESCHTENTFKLFSNIFILNIQTIVGDGKQLSLVLLFYNRNYN